MTIDFKTISALNKDLASFLDDMDSTSSSESSHDVAKVNDTALPKFVGSGDHEESIVLPPPSPIPVSGRALAAKAPEMPEQPKLKIADSYSIVSRTPGTLKMRLRACAAREKAAEVLATAGTKRRSKEDSSSYTEVVVEALLGIGQSQPKRARGEEKAAPSLVELAVLQSQTKNRSDTIF